MLILLLILYDFYNSLLLVHADVRYELFKLINLF